MSKMNKKKMNEEERNKELLSNLPTFLNKKNIVKQNILLTPHEVSQILRVSEDSLAVWRCTNAVSISFIKIGKAVKYQLEDIQNFILSNKYIHKEQKIEN